MFDFWSRIVRKMNLNWKKYGASFGLLSILMIFLTLNVVNVYGLEEETGPSWQLIYLQEGICRTGQFQTAENYSALVEEYFELYQFKSTKTDPTCLQTSEYLENNSSYDSDLVILIYSPEIGNRVLGTLGIDGAYIHQGTDRQKNHVVFVCDCSEYAIAYEKKLPSWVLSHELSHFILSFKQYTQSQVEQIVHNIDDRYDDCIRKNYSDVSCNQVRMLVSPNYATRDYIVMTPYPPAIGEKLTNYVTDKITNSSEFIQLNHEQIDSWIKGEISDKTMILKIKESFELNNNSIDSPHFSHSLTNGFIIAEKSNDKSIAWSDLMSKIESKDSKFNLFEYLPSSPSEVLIEDDKEVPNWFKNRARLWTQDRIGDNVFFSGIDQLFRTGVIGVS